MNIWIKWKWQKDEYMNKMKIKKSIVNDKKICELNYIKINEEKRKMWMK